MTAVELVPVDALKESMITADLARNADAREVAAWCYKHHPDLQIAVRAKQSEDRFQLLHHAYIGVKAVTA